MASKLYLELIIIFWTSLISSWLPPILNCAVPPISTSYWSGGWDRGSSHLGSSARGVQRLPRLVRSAIAWRYLLLAKNIKVQFLMPMSVSKQQWHDLLATGMTTKTMQTLYKYGTRLDVLEPLEMSTPLLPNQLRLSVWATFVVCTPSFSLLTEDVTGLMLVFYAGVEGMNPLGK